MLPLWVSQPATLPATNLIRRKRLCHSGPCQQQLCHGALASKFSRWRPLPATNLIWRRRSPAWLAIWRIWAGFANSQLLRATFQSIYLYTCAHPHCCYLGSAAQTDANLSAHLHRLPTPPPYLRQMRLLHGWGAGIRCWMRRLPGKGRRCWVQDEAGV